MFIFLYENTPPFPLPLYIKTVFLTSVCTMAGRCVLNILTVWKISTTPSYLILSNTMLRVMNTPVLPTPALLQ